MIKSLEDLERIWNQKHHPHISQLLEELAQNNDRKRPALDNFIRFISKIFKFYANILNETLPGLNNVIPVERIVSTLKLHPSKQRITTLDDDQCVQIIHKCVIYIADLSRYRTHAAKTYMPKGHLSKQDNNNYSKSIELYKLALLILPNGGEPFNHIAIIDNAKNDKFNVVYNFIRAILTSTPHMVAYSNLLNLLKKQPNQNSIWKRFLQCNKFNRNGITKNDRMELLKSQFLVLVCYHFLPQIWSNQIKDLPKIETEFYKLMSKLDFHKQIFNDFYFKQLVILLGGFELLIDQSEDVDSSPEVIEQYLKFIMRYVKTFLSTVTVEWGDYITNKKDNLEFSTSLLPSLRLLVNWFNARSLPRLYVNQSTDIQNLFGGIVNRMYIFFESHNVEQLYDYVGVPKPPVAKDMRLQLLLNNKPRRQRLFKEDVTIREFKPVGYLMSDFNDDKLYIKDENAILALIGESNQIDKANDNILRLTALVVMIKHVLRDSHLKWDSSINRYEVEEQQIETERGQKPEKEQQRTQRVEIDDSNSKKNNNNNKKKNNSNNNNNNIQLKYNNNNNNLSILHSIPLEGSSSNGGYAGASFSNFDSKLPSTIKMPLVRKEESKDDQLVNMVNSIVEDTHIPMMSTNPVNYTNYSPNWFSNGIWSNNPQWNGAAGPNGYSQMPMNYFSQQPVHPQQQQQQQPQQQHHRHNQHYHQQLPSHTNQQHRQHH